MIQAVADTHTVIWYLAADSRLSATAKNTIETIIQSGDQIAISSITLIEIVYLVEKGKITATKFTQLANELSSPSSSFAEIPINLAVARALSKVNALEVPDMPDRIIAATALHLNIPVISRDAKIQQSAIATIW